MENNVLSELTDVMLRIKAAIEEKDVDTLRRLLAKSAQININGRFYTVDQLAENVRLILDRLEQPTLDILSIEESELRDNEAFVTYATEFFWIDQEIWEEHSVPGLVSLQMARQEDAWQVRGFSFQQRKERPQVDIDREEPTPGIGAGGMQGGRPPMGIAPLFSFWY